MMDDKEKIREAIGLLLENFWFTRKHHSDEYMLIKQNRKEIQKFFLENFGYQLLVNNAVVKLEKLPSETAPWMGIKEFSDTLDYVFFMATLSYLEDKATDDIFIVSMLSDYIKQFVANDIEVKWENYHTRLSFVRVMKFVEKQHMLEVMEGEINLYKDDENTEVLYRPTMISKYFTRYFSKSVHEFQTQQEMLEDRWRVEGFDNARIRRQSISRKLFSAPVLYRNELDEEEKKYFSNYGYSVEDAFDEYTPYELETYRNELVLISTQRNSKVDQYPNGKMLSQIALQFGSLVQKKVNQLTTFPDFEWEVPRHEFVNWVEELKASNDYGWSKEYRENYPETIATDLIAYYQDWKFLREDTKAMSIAIYPILTRIGGNYPIEFRFQRYFIDKLKEGLGIHFPGAVNLSMDLSELEQWVSDFKGLFLLKTFSWKRVEDAIGGFTRMDHESGSCWIDMETIRKKDKK